jgi:putative cardiolipin synthase
MRIRTVAKWSLGGLVGIALLLYATFIGLLEITERQWLAEAPQHPSTNARILEDHDWAQLDVGADSLATRLRLIDSAKESIDLEFFIYELDTASRLISSALERRAREGVRVRVLVDFARPVFKLRPVFAGKLQEAGVEVRYYNTVGILRFFAIQHRTHRKMLIVDGQAAVIGGRNIGDDYFDLSRHYNFLDSDVLIRGKIVGVMADSFEHYWTSSWVAAPEIAAGSPETAAGGKDTREDLSSLEQEQAQSWMNGHAGDADILGRLLQQPPLHRVHRCRDVQFVTDHPGSGVERRVVYGEIVRLAKESKRKILLESPYLVLRRDGLRDIRDIVANGVEIHALTNGLHSTDAYYTVSALIPTLPDLQLQGLYLYAYTGRHLAGQDARPQGMQAYDSTARWGVHAKRAIFDDRTVAVGTYNIDPRSANLNSELMLVCRNNPEIAGEAAESFAQRKNESRLIAGADDALGVQGILADAEDEKRWKTYAIMPIAWLLNFLL